MDSKYTSNKKWSIAIHGGAGVIVLDDENQFGRTKVNYLQGLEDALKAGQTILENGGTSMDAVEAAVKSMEDNPLFNAGRGSVFTSIGTHEMDASIMDGSTKQCGAVSGICKVKNPISAARLVMQKTPHIMLIGENADTFASNNGLETVDPSWFDDEFRRLQLQTILNNNNKKSVQLDHSTEQQLKEAGKKGTVGAVALDVHGNLAAATSTGGMTNKMPGRVGDSPIIGAGTYANNNTCAISGTGVGEQFIRNCVAFDISALMEYKGLSLEEAAREVVHKKLKPGDGGVIGVDKNGSVAMIFNSPGMFRGMATSDGEYELKIWKDQ